MKLYLVRHAIAEERDAFLWPDDSGRPLTKRGVRRFRKAVRGLVSLVPEVEVLLSSPYERAWHTATILEKAGWPAPSVCEELARDEPGSLIRALQAHSDAASLALVGHEPYLSRFAAALLGSPRAPWGEMRKGGGVCLALDQLNLTSQGDLVWLAPPRVLRRLC